MLATLAVNFCKKKKKSRYFENIYNHDLKHYKDQQC